MKKRYGILSILLIIGLVCGLLIGLFSKAKAEEGFYLKVESYSWREYYQGSKLLEESGPLFGAGFISRLDFSKYFMIDMETELFGGSVDYDGHTQAGVPAQTDTNYFGVNIDINFYRKFELTGGRKIVCTSKCTLREAYLAPFVGVGVKRWNRQIESTDVAQGYTEKWLNIYTRLGLLGEYSFSLSKVKGFAEAGITLPLYTSNTFECSVFGLSEDVTLKPGSNVAFFAKAGIKWTRFEAFLFYDGMRFSKSDLDDTYHVFFQPESKCDMYGINFAFYF